MTILGHPAGLFLLFLVEMWERFSYYGMRGLLVLYLVQSATPAPDASGLINPGRGWSRADASMLYGWYTGLAYLLPIAGGVVADRFLGTHRSMVAGALLIALGHLVLAVSGLGELARSTLGMTVFILGLALVVIGTGHFKPCVSVMVGQLYPHGDGRRDGAFTIFYMGINLGAFLSAFVCGTLGERVGWHWGFGSAAVGMLAGLALYTSLRPRFLADVGLPPPGARNLLPVTLAGGATAAVAFAALYHTGAIVALADGVERLDTMFGRPWLLPALL
ncbi:MAG TPA: oligopeptide:H+ symporter, partial [Candidatus Binatia bacterium]|nr:oligopeptide:H+ symporter [Candidatus Binatia bacterium]